MATKYARAAGGAWATDATWSTTSGGAADTTAPGASDDAVIDTNSGAVTSVTGSVTSLTITNTTSKTTAVTFSGTLTCSGAFSVTGNSATNRIICQSTTLGTARTISAASVSLTNVDFRDITAAGAATWTGTSLGDALGNTGITFSQGYGGTMTGGAGEYWASGAVTNVNTTATSLTLIACASATDWTPSASKYLASWTSLTGALYVSTAGAIGFIVRESDGGFPFIGSSASVAFADGAAGWVAAKLTVGTKKLNFYTSTNDPDKHPGFDVTGGDWTLLGTADRDFSAWDGTFGSTTTARLSDNSASAWAGKIYRASGAIDGTSPTWDVYFTNETAGSGSITDQSGIAWTGTGLTVAHETRVKTRYAVATGNVSATATWSASSGGAAGASVPLCHDNIILNAASGAITVTNDMPRMCADFTCTGYTGTFTNSATTEVYGSTTFGSGMTVSGTAVVGLYGRGSHTVTSAGKTRTTNLYIYGGGGSTGTYTLADAFTSDRSSAFAFYLVSGTFNDGGFAMTFTGAAGGINLGGGTGIFTGTKTIASTTATAPWTCTSTLTDTGTIVLSGATATDRTFAGGGKTYGTLTDSNTSTGKLTITGANTFGTINKTAAAACTLALPTSSGITVTGLFNVNGVSGAVLTLTGDVTKAEGTVSCDYLSISSSDAAGGATFYAGANSTDGGTNTGWIFGAPSGLSAPYSGGSYVGGALNSEPTVEGALVVT